MPTEINWEALGYKSGQAQAERDGAYFDPTRETIMFGPNGEVEFIAGGVVNGGNPEGGQTGPAVWEEWGAKIAPVSSLNYNLIVRRMRSFKPTASASRRPL